MSKKKDMFLEGLSFAEQTTKKQMEQYENGGSDNVLSNISEMGKDKYIFKYLNKNDIVVNELNKRYSQDDQEKMEALKNSILSVGLIHNLVVASDGNGKYRLISGERRYHAIMSMTEEEYSYAFPQGIPAKIESAAILAEDEEIELIEANLLIRDEKDTYGKYLDMKRLLELYDKKKEQGENKYTHAALASVLSMTERQLSKYNRAAQMIPELEAFLKEGKINIKDAAKFGSLTEEAQALVAQVLSETGKVDDVKIKELQKRDQENRELKKQLEAAKQEIEKSELQKKAMESRIESLQIEADREGSDENGRASAQITEEMDALRDIIARQEKQIKRQKTDMEKLMTEAKEKAMRNLNITSEDLKKASSIAKAENLTSTITNSISDLVKLKAIVSEDDGLKNEIRVAVARLMSLIE